VSEDQDNIEFLLSEYTDGQLSDEQSRQMEERLLADPALREQASLYRKLNLELFASRDEELAGVDYDAQRHEIMAKLERKALLARPRFNVIRVVFAGSLAAAAAVLIAASAWIYFRSSTATSAPQQPVAELQSVPQQHPSAGTDTVEVATVTGERASEPTQVSVRSERVRALDQQLAASGPGREIAGDDARSGTVLMTIAAPAPKHAAADNPIDLMMFE
jgi:anti-sigma factor RsiW